MIPGSGPQDAAEIGPTRDDITFGRALIAFRLATKEQVEACVAEMRRYQAQGRQLTLAQIMVGLRIISVEQYQGVVREIHARLQAMQQRSIQALQAPGGPFGPPVPAPGQPAGYGAGPGPSGAAGPRVVSAKLLPPALTASGRYASLYELTGNAPQPREVEAPPASDEELEEASRAWERASAEIEAESAAKLRGGGQGGEVPQEIPSTHTDPGYEVLPPSTEEPGRPPTPSQPKLTTPQAAKERRDAGIRKMLGVAENAEQFDFGPYRILGEVASGGMGIIYRAREGATGAVYALKALLNVESANEKQLKRFIQEAQSAMKLDHPGIVKIHDLGVFENIPYFAMDFIEGQDLHHLLRDKAVTPEQALRILVKVCEAVHYAHTQGVIHRDLKPANVVVRPDGTPILTDFGLAKNLDSQFKLTAEGAMVGTPLYLSPEQVTGKANLVDGRCDVYGLGVMLYQILTDRLPFFGRNPYEVYRKVTEEDPPKPTAINPAASPEVEKICLMALAKDREERYASAAEMGEDIRRFLRGERVRAKLPTPAAELKKKGGAWSSSGGIPATDGSGSVSRAGDGPDEGGSKVVLGVILLLVLVILLGVGYLVYALVNP